MFNIPTNYKDLTQAMIAIVDSKNDEQLRQDVAISGTDSNMIKRAIAVYFRARHSKSALANGLIGVGLMTYADSRLATFSKRISKLF